jgi:hypothetical protein
MAQRFQTLIKHSGGFVICDAISDFSFESMVEATDQPIDDNGFIADHVIRKPQRLSLTLVSTQTPMRVIDGFSVQSQPLLPQSVTYGKQRVPLKIQPRAGFQPTVSAAIDAGLGALRKAVSGTPSIEGLKVGPKQAKPMGITVLKAGADVDRIGEFFDLLLKLQADAELLTISFKGRDYPGFLLEGVTKTDKPGQLGRSTFPITLKKIRTVQTKQINLPPVPRAKAKKDRGVQYGPPPPPPPWPLNNPEVRSSILGQLLTAASE